MIRKLTFVLIIALVVSQQVYAADLLWRIMHNDQDALIVGEILHEVSGSYKIDVKHVVSGHLPNKQITISNDFKYYTPHLEPSVGDFLVLSLDKKILNYYIKYGAFKSTTGDYETLKLYKEDLSFGLQGDLTVLEYYINSNGEYKDFNFKENGVYLRKPNREEVLIFSRDDMVFTTSFNPEQVIDTVATVEVDTEKNNPLSPNRIIMAMLVFGVLVVIYLFIKKK